MALVPESPAHKLYLGIDGGGTRTVALLANDNGEIVRRSEAGPANLKLLTDEQLIQQLQSFAEMAPRPDALGIGLAGAWAESDQDRIRSAAAKVWPGVPCYATTDLETALTDAPPPPKAKRIPQVLLVSGTGSACYGKTADGKGVKVGAWGHVLGDKGSGYEIGLRGLKAVVYYFDQDQAWPALGQRLLSALELNEPNDLIDWAQAASKAEIARLAVEVFAASNRKDKIASDIIASAANSLARNAVTCAKRLTREGTQVQFVLAGSILLKQPRFGARIGRELRKLWPKAIVTPVRRESVWGAVELARRFVAKSKVQSPGSTVQNTKSRVQRSQVRGQSLESTKQSPTEARNPYSMKLDTMAVSEGITLMLSEDAKVPKALMGERGHIEFAVKAIVRAFRRSGRLFYVGAGTSGRLGVLDASECPATFRTPPDMVQGIIAGGQSALWKAAEGAEDDAGAGGRAIGFRDVSARDVVVGIAASGTTPYVWGALQEAKARGATTILLCFNPFLKIPRAMRPSVVIAPNLGPEVLTGSTRLKAGTATKLVLNIFTTLAMARTGKVTGNLMIDMQPANKKLRDRAVRIVQDLSRAAYPAAERALELSAWDIKKAIGRLNGK